MKLNWEDKIVTTCEQLGIDPETFAEEPDLREWMADHFGFESYASFFALAIPKDIVAGMALPMLPNHRNYEYHLACDCIELICHNYDLYADEDRTQQESENLLNFAHENFSLEVKVATLKKIIQESENKILISAGHKSEMCVAIKTAASDMIWE